MTHRNYHRFLYVSWGNEEKCREEKNDHINLIRFFAEDVTISRVRYCVENEEYFLLHFFFFFCE